MFASRYVGAALKKLSKRAKGLARLRIQEALFEAEQMEGMQTQTQTQRQRIHPVGDVQRMQLMHQQMHPFLVHPEHVHPEHAGRVSMSMRKSASDVQTEVHADGCN